MDKTITVFFAVSGRGQGNVYLERPERNDKLKIWVGPLDGCISSFVSMMEADGLELPPLKWDDDPYPITITTGYV